MKKKKKRKLLKDEDKNQEITEKNSKNQSFWSFLILNFQYIAV